MLACGVGGNPGGADAIVVAEYGERRRRWEVLYAKRRYAHEAMSDCVKWFEDVREELMRLAREKQ